MTDRPAVPEEPVLRRRRFLRGGALVAAAAGGAVAGSAGAVPAAATDGQAVLAGRLNTQTTTTTLASAGAVPPLTLTNPDGATLLLTPLADTGSWDGSLPVGALASSDLGPFVGVVDDDGSAYTSWLATGDDLARRPTTEPVEPVRLWDSRARRGTVVARSSSGAVDRKGRLVRGEWVDLEVASTSTDTTPVAAFLTLVSAGASRDGALTAYAPGSRPPTLSLAFGRGRAASSAAFVEVGVTRRSFAVRLHTTQTTYVTVDLTGITRLAVPGPDHVAVERQAGVGAAAAARTAWRRPR